MIWATVSSRSCFCWVYFLHLRLQRILSIWFWYWPFGDFHVQRHLFCFWKMVYAMTSVFSWQKSVSLSPASFCSPRPNLPVTSGISWLPTFAFQSLMMERTSLFCVSSKGLHRTIELQLLQHYWSRHRLGLLGYWWFALETNMIILSFLRRHPSTAFWTLLLTMRTTHFF